MYWQDAGCLDYYFTTLVVFDLRVSEVLVREHFQSVLNKGEETSSFENAHIQLAVVYPSLSPNRQQAPIKLYVANNN